MGNKKKSTFAFSLWIVCIDDFNIYFINYLSYARCQFICVISANAVHSGAAWEIVQILIRWLRQKPADLDIHCFLKLIYPRVNKADNTKLYQANR